MTAPTRPQPSAATEQLVGDVLFAMADLSHVVWASIPNRPCETVLWRSGTR